MTTESQETSTRLAICDAMEARDRAAAVDAFAPDAVVRSPFTGRIAFNGQAQIGPLIDVVLDVLEDLHYTDELRDRDKAFLVARARVRGNELELVDHLRLDESGKISEMTVFFRPLPATTAALGLFGSGLVRPHSPAKALLILLLSRPLALLASAGDRIGAALVRPTL